MREGRGRSFCPSLYVVRDLCYFLERETRKLLEVAWSDAVVQAVADETGADVFTLRDEALSLSQPAEAGWHFYADDRDKARAEELASAWALAFTEQAGAEMAAQVDLNALVRVQATQVENLPIRRSISLSTYITSGAVGFLALSALLVLFFKPK